MGREQGREVNLVRSMYAVVMVERRVWIIPEGPSYLSNVKYHRFITEIMDEDGRECIPRGDIRYEIVKDDIPQTCRDSWDLYFMKIARQVATRGTCSRKQVGCVIVRDRTILATGYNGSIRGMPHCDDVGHMMENGHCTRTVHAEQNAVAQAARNGVSVIGSDLYVTSSPCWTCFKIVANAGIRRIVFGEFYRDDRIFDAAEFIGMELAWLDDTGELKVYVKGR